MITSARQLADQLGPIGIWTNQLDTLTAPQLRETIAELEAEGLTALWYGEAVGREAFTLASLVLAASRGLTVATGIANIYGRDPVTAAAAANTLAEAYPRRFVMGLGVSHHMVVTGFRGHTYGPPLRAMTDYLEALDANPYVAPEPADRPPRILAALGPKMLALAGSHTGGALTYLVTPGHTMTARSALGPDPILAVEQTIVLESDPDKARGKAREFLALYLDLPNFRHSMLRQGFKMHDLAAGGTDALVDTLVAWGDRESIMDRVDSHRANGADHVCLQEVSGVPLTKWWPEIAAGDQWRRRTAESH
jgi:probable F420-dependent oxidoreductase